MENTKINYRKSAMIKELITRYDFISKIGAIKLLGTYFPESSISERIDAWTLSFAE